jgi:hypothetical protein
MKNGTFLPKLFRTAVRKNYSSDREKLLKFEAEGREFAEITRTIFSNECFFNLFTEDSQI